MTSAPLVHQTAIVASNVELSLTARVGAYAVVGDAAGAATIVGPEAEIGPHVHVGGGLHIGRSATLSPGAVVTADVPPYAVVGGNPATIRGYTNPQGERKMAAIRASDEGERQSILTVGGGSLLRLRSATDLRGSLVVGEFADLPFMPTRFFAVHSVMSGLVRGEHAHKRCEQLLIAVAGSVRCILDSGYQRREIILDTPEAALHIPGMVWGTQFGHSPDAVLVVLASLPYNPDDYIREYEEFLALIASQGNVDPLRAGQTEAAVP